MASDILDLALKRYELAKDGWQEINQKAKDDQRFLSDAPYAQWDSDDASARVRLGRPVVEIDQLSQYTQQVKNDIRLNTPTIKVIPAGAGADIETAEVIEGRIKAIEYKSNADSAYDLAADFAVDSSLGFIRVDHDYVSDKGFEQELRIKRVINPQAVLLDPDSIEADGSDAKYCFVLEEIGVKEFEKLYPDAAPVSFGDIQASNAPQDKDKITIAEYFYIEEEPEEYGLLEDGSSEIMADGRAYKSTRKISKRTVKKCWLAGKDTLSEPTKFPGKYVPMVPVYGREKWIGGKRSLLSLIRKAKSSARMYNALKSSETEILLKQQQAPVQAAVGQMRGFEDNWKQPDKAMVLYYHQTDVNGQPAPPPQRLNPPVVSSGYAAASIDAENNIKKSLGMYSAAVGNREGDSSGVALRQLEQSSDLATADFNDNLIRSITHVGKIIVCALPEVEDTQRLVQTIGREDEMKMVGINGAMAPDQKRSYDFSKGEWDVRVVTGASFTTQRQEAAAYYSDLVGKMPDLMPVIGDLVFKYQDAPGAQAISSRLKKLVDPKLLDDGEQEQGNPELQAMQKEATQVMQTAQAEIQQLQQQLAETEAALKDKANESQIKIQMDYAKLEADKEESQRNAELKALELQIKNRELDIKEREAFMRAAEAELGPNQQPPIEGDSMPTTEEELLARLEALRNQKAQEQMQRELEARSMEMKMQQEEMERQEKAAYEQRLLQTLGGIQQQLEAIARPKNIIFAPDGTPTGIK